MTVHIWQTDYQRLLDIERKFAALIRYGVEECDVYGEAMSSILEEDASAADAAKDNEIELGS